MPEVKPILDSLFDSGKMELDKKDYVIDIKVHMLMPGQYPCVPGWHCDFIPRDESKVKNASLISGEEMYLWVSGEPKTEFKTFKKELTLDGYKWKVFTQRDSHRGTPAKDHTWRCFIRVIPKKFIHGFTLNVGEIRRHSQVYLVNENYTW